MNSMSYRRSLNKLMLFTILVSSMLLLEACSGRSSWPIFGGKTGRTGDDDTPFSTRVHTGIYGVEMRFVNNEPPRTFYYSGPGAQFDLMLEMRNRGATPVTEGWLYLSGYDKNIIRPLILTPSGRTLPMAFTLEGVSNFNPEGGYDTIEFENDILLWPSGTDSYSPRFRASACYKYQTRANPVVCIDPVPFSSMQERKTCQVRNIPMSGGQGAPIQVTLVEEEATEDFVYFRIHISNAQTTGVVYDWQKVNPTYTDSCPYNLEYQDINKVHYEPPSFLGANSPQFIECKPDSPVRLVDNKAVIYCKFSVTGLEDTYETPLNIVFDYGYLNYIEQEIKIVNAMG